MFLPQHSHVFEKVKWFIDVSIDQGPHIQIHEVMFSRLSVRKKNRNTNAICVTILQYYAKVLKWSWEIVSRSFSVCWVFLDIGCFITYPKFLAQLITWSFSEEHCLLSNLKLTYECFKHYKKAFNSNSIALTFLGTLLACSMKTYW